MAQIKETAVVYSQEMLAPDIYSMWIATKAAADAKPGQFISVYSNDSSRLLPREREQKNFPITSPETPSRSWDRWEMASLRRGRRCSSSEEESESRRC